jgi:hypothetical protein
MILSIGVYTDALIQIETSFMLSQSKDRII